MNTEHYQKKSRINWNRNSDFFLFYLEKATIMQIITKMLIQMEHTIKAHLSIILEKCLKFTGVRLDSRLPPLTSKTFDVSTLSPLLSCILAIFDCSKFPYFLNAKSVAYSSIPENEKEINIFSILTIFSKTFNFGSILANQTSKFQFSGCLRIF